MKRIIPIFAIIFLSFCALNAQNIQPKFDKKTGFYGFVNEKGKAVTDFKYSYAEVFSDGLALVASGLNFGYIDSTGAEVIAPKFYDAGTFSDGLAYVSEGNKYGYINKTGKIVIDLKYERAFDFSAGFALVKILNPDMSVFGDDLNVSGIIDRYDNLISSKWYNVLYRKPNNTFEGYIQSEKYIFSTTDNEIEKIDLSNEIFKIVDTTAEFVGGMKELMNFLSKNINYPTVAAENGISGRVVLRFIIDEQGKIRDVIVLGSIAPILDKEAVRVIKSMPDWIPAELDGNKVKQYYTLPVKFSLH
jgi:TonB family protein